MKKIEEKRLCSNPLSRVLKENINKIHKMQHFTTLRNVVRHLGGKNPPHRGTIPFWLYIVPTDLVSVFLHVGNLQILIKTCQHVFLHFFYKTLI